MTPSLPNHDASLPPPTESEEAALAWFVRCQRGLSAEEETAFEHWLAADARHATLFNELDGTWTLLGSAGEALPLPRAEVATVPTLSPRRWSRAWRSVVWPLAAAAALVLGYVGWWRPTHYQSELATEVGGLRTERLPDGSVVTLNTDSVVSARFTPEERRVQLVRGEAHFAVAKNAVRPFIVEAAGVSVRAVGTAFNVRLDAQSVEVLVTEGRVRVDDTASGKSLLARPEASGSLDLPSLGDPVLASGHRVIVALPTPVAPVTVALQQTLPAVVSDEAMQRELAWRGRRLDFELATLQEIVTEFNRYNRHRLIIADPALAEKRFGGSFKPDDQAGFVRMLRENFEVQAEESETATVLRARP